MKQRRGYPDQWPYAVNIYMDDSGRCKGDATLKYEDPNAASAAPNFFDGSELTGRPGVKLGVTLAGKYEAPAAAAAAPAPAAAAPERSDRSSSSRRRSRSRSPGRRRDSDRRRRRSDSRSRSPARRRRSRSRSPRR